MPTCTASPMNTALPAMMSSAGLSALSLFTTPNPFVTRRFPAVRTRIDIARFATAQDSSWPTCKKIRKDQAHKRGSMGVMGEHTAHPAGGIPCGTIVHDSTALPKDRVKPMESIVAPVRLEALALDVYPWMYLPSRHGGERTVWRKHTRKHTHTQRGVSERGALRGPRRHCPQAASHVLLDKGSS